jgi:lipoprotein-releasing system permease protein
MVSTSRWEIPDKNEEAPGPTGTESESDDGEIVPAPLPGIDTELNTLGEGLRPGIVLGEELADSLQVDVGNEVTIISPQDGVGFLGVQPKSRSFRVAAIFRTGMYEFDLKLAYCSLSEAQRFFHLDSQVNRIELRLLDVNQSGEILSRVTQVLNNPNLTALDWKSLNKKLFSALALEKIVMFVVLAFIILVASFNIVGSLIMIILEKAKEIAILKSMGATARNTRSVFLVVGAFIGVIGSVAGLMVGLATCWFIHQFGIKLPQQYYIEMLPVHVDPPTITAVFVSAILICLLATVYPASQAARLRPVEGLRFD